ncbi:MAG: hypothetical protein AW12_02917 [Candidatus Accumulibacter sp. BA-94]|nr:MAG: hypothetical protein AW12_02917 [Candidatus Accumulibacter sp. BA-94]
MLLPQCLRQLEDRHRVEARAVVAGDDVEVVEAKPILGRCAGRDEVDQGGRAVAVGHRRNPPRGEFADGQRRLDADGEEGGGIAADRCRHGDRLHGDRLARLPPMLLQEAGNAADRVRIALPQVDAVIAVEIDGITPLAAGHELRDADGAGVGTLDAERADAVLAREEQELLEFAAEELRSRRVEERERCQRLEDAEAAHVLAVDRFDADDGDDHLGRHAMDRLGALQRRGMCLPERQSAREPLLIDETPAIALP